MSQPSPISTGLLRRYESQIARDLFATLEPFRFPDDQHESQSDPAAYRYFLSVCFEIKRATGSGQKEAMKKNYQKLRTISWGQSPARSLDEEIKATIPSRQKDLSEDELDKIATETLRFVLLGQASFDDENAPDRDTYVQCLNIYLAIGAACKKLHPEWES